MRLARYLLAFLLVSLPAAAQFTQVSGTVIDPNGIPYANGTIAPILVNVNGGSSVTLNGQAYTPPTQASGLDSTGSFVLNLAANASLSPAGTKWNFWVCSAVGTVNPSIGTGSQCFTLAAPITIAGATQSISANLQAAALALTKVAGGGSTTTSVATPEQFGAVGDGVHDDTAALQSAINKCSGAGLGYMTSEASTPPTNYCTVVLGEKVYFTATCNLQVAASQVHIVGQGMRSSIIMCGSATADIIDVAGTGFTSTTAAAWDYFSDFAVMRNVAPSGTPGGFVWKFAIWNFAYRVESWDSIRGFSLGTSTVGHINLYDAQAVGGNQTGTNASPAAGFYLSGSLNSSRMTNCVTSSNGYGMYITGVADLFVDRFEALTGLEGIYVTGGSGDVRIVAPIIEGGVGSVHVVNNNPTAIKIEIHGGYFHGGTSNPVPIQIENSSNVEIIGGDSNSTANSNAVLVETGSHDVLISGLMIFVTTGSSTAIPIVVNGTGGTTRIAITNNVIQAAAGNPGNAGIELFNGAVNNTVTGNTIGGFFTNGIVLDATSNTNVVTGNQIDSTNITNPVVNSGANNVLANNRGGVVGPTIGTSSNCSSSASPAVCGSSAAGSVTIAAAATTITVNSTAVTANSQILVSEDSSLGAKLSVTCNTTTGRMYTVTSRTAATSFVITASAAPVTNPACLSYQIIN